MGARASAAKVRTLETDQARALLFDDATGAVRWPLLLDRTEVALARARRDKRFVAVFVFDKPSTELKKAMPASTLVGQIASLLRPDDTVGRIADRTFVVVCNEIRADQDAAAIAQRLLRNMGMVATLGIALGTPDDDAEALLNRALEQARVRLGRPRTFRPAKQASQASL